VRRSTSTTASAEAELSCRELVELATEYLDGVLPQATRARVEAHLGDCDGCERFLEQLRQTVRLAGLLLRAH
jgi:anti-sigma factor RsiW